jgi:hypothetical protein
LKIVVLIALQLKNFSFWFFYKKKKKNEFVKLMFIIVFKSLISKKEKYFKTIFEIFSKIKKNGV